MANPTLPKDLQGFSVESADLAHGYLTSRLMTQRVSPSGAVAGRRVSEPVEVDGSSTTVHVAPGTARIVTLDRKR